MPSKWTGEVVGTMHVENIKFRDLARHMGITNRYLSMLLNSKRESPTTEQRVKTALSEMVEARHAESQAE